MANKLKIKKDDQVVIIAGRDKGKKGTVTRAFPAENRVLVSGINMVKRHQRPDRTQAGGIVEKELSIHVSNVALLDPKEDKPTRVGFKRLDDGSKVRVAKRSGEVVNA